ncbi:Proteasomal ATPase-associated factor 1 [Schistosoma japonicum]|nr:Proteasomal ATPase-associated factor 1 [Schistosoma japonicum]KAH8857528.1 Proteasomal ATPase-associated factor 1 [Schistosoma japonicum]
MLPLGFRLQPDWNTALKLEIKGSSLVPDDETVLCNLLSPVRSSYQTNAVLETTTAFFDKHKYQQCPDFSFDLLRSTSKNVGPDSVPCSHLSSFDVSPSGEHFIASFTGSSVNLYESETWEVRRSLEGHVGDILTCKFFPSGLVALTGGSDMQLKIWCLITGRCAATLSSKSTEVGYDDKTEPRGHRAGILDTAIVDRGRNITSIDRLGWLRLWDVATQTCISATPITAGAVETRTIVSSVLEEITCMAIRKHPSLPIQAVDPVNPDSWYEVRETSSTTAQEVATSDALVAVGTGTNASVRLYELAARQKGCVANCILPNANGSVEACAFPEDLPIPFSKEMQFIDVPRSCVTSFADYGLFAGGQQGELASWDIRQTKQPLWQLTHEKGAVKHIRVCRRPNSQYFLLIVSRNDGRTLVYPYDPAVAHGDAQMSTSLELTGVNCEPICGLSLVHKSSGEINVWTAARSGTIHRYTKLLDEITFRNP